MSQVIHAYVAVLGGLAGLLSLIAGSIMLLLGFFGIGPGLVTAAILLFVIGPLGFIVSGVAGEMLDLDS